MGMFDMIQNAIASAAQSSGAAPQPAQQQGGDAGGLAGGLAEVGAGSTTLSNVDVERVLQGLAEQKGRTNLNWRTSIADLMRLLDLDPSLQHREQLADELGYTGTKDGSAEMNIWLYRKVMEQLEQNGGAVPDSLKH
jgi:Domain of unknown function (DUF3597)